MAVDKFGLLYSECNYVQGKKKVIMLMADGEVIG